MHLFFCDLDGTLIYSHKRNIGADAIPVERYQNQDISFVTPKSMELLRLVSSRCKFIPTTTRTLEQYNRIQLPGIAVTHALVCNGGRLIVDGQEDLVWYQASLDLVQPSYAMLLQARQLLLSDPDVNFEVRFLSELFLFTKSRCPEETLQRLQVELDGSLVQAYAQGSKIYVVPVALNKGSAALRLSARLGASALYGAGDTGLDIPMLNAVHHAYAAEPLRQLSGLETQWAFPEPDCLFSEFFLAKILQELSEHESAGHSLM